MKKYMLFVLVCILANMGFAQIRTITNFDLEKFKRARLKAEKDLRENYEKLGFPSPEELRKQNEKSAREFSEFLRELRAERLEKERLQIERERLQIERERLRILDAQQDMQRRNDNELRFTGYRGYYGVTYTYPYFSNKSAFRNNGKSQVRVGGRAKADVRKQNQVIGVSDFLTRQNMIKSSKAETAFRNRLFFGAR